MKTMFLIAGLALSLGSAATADPIYGLWKTQPDEGVFYHVKMQACGGSICGKFVQKFENGAPVSSSVVGKNAVYDMKPVGGGAYEGKAWRPSNDKVYAGKGSLNGNALRMKGCVLGGLVCIGQDWTRLQ
jgi:uncharacterized protein (DUF2147 family)